MTMSGGVKCDGERSCTFKSFLTFDVSISKKLLRRASCVPIKDYGGVGVGETELLCLHVCRWAHRWRHGPAALRDALRLATRHNPMNGVIGSLQVLADGREERAVGDLMPAWGWRMGPRFRCAHHPRRAATLAFASNRHARLVSCARPTDFGIEIALLGCGCNTGNFSGARRARDGGTGTA